MCGSLKLYVCVLICVFLLYLCGFLCVFCETVQTDSLHDEHNITGRASICYIYTCVCVCVCVILYYNVRTCICWLDVCVCLSVCSFLCVCYSE